MALWTPAQITTALWLDAADSSTVTLVSGVVSQWADKSGNNRHATQGTAALRPAYTDNAIVFTFDALTVPVSAWPSEGYSMALVMQSSTTGGSSCGLVNINSNPNDDPEIRLGVGDSAYAYYNGGYAINTASGLTTLKIVVLELTAGVKAELFDNGTSVASGTRSGALTTTGEFSLGKYSRVSQTRNGSIKELVVYQSNTTNRQLIEGYYAHKWGLAAGLPSDHPYKDAAPTIPSTTIRSLISMPYALEGSLRNLLAQDYALTTNYRAICAQVYGLRMLAVLVQKYGDVPQFRALLDQVWGDAAMLRRTCTMKYGDALRLRAKLEQTWAMYANLRATMGQDYHIAGEVLRQLLAQSYDLRQYADLRALVDQLYVISPPEEAVEQRPPVLAVSGGLDLSWHHISIEVSEDSYSISGEIHLADEAEFLQVAHLQEVRVTIDATTFVLLANLPRESGPEVGRDEFYIPLVSPAVLLDEPHTAITREFAGSMASAIAAEMAATAGVTIDWRLVDWYIPAATLYANGETPLAIIRKLALAVGGVLQSAPDGTLICRPEYPHTLPERETATPDFYLTDQDNFFSVDGNPETRDGYNRFLISDQDQTAAETGLTLEQRDIDEQTKEVLVYRVPWTGAPIVLRTSGGSWVSIVDEGVVSEILTETVEIVAGEGRVTKPLYEKLGQEYRQVSLGAITPFEDGHLASETPGNSLVEISYRTQYHLFRVSDVRIEEVQFYPEELA